MAQLRAIQEACPNVLTAAEEIVATTDLLFYLVTNETIADPVMPQRQGLVRNDGKKMFEDNLGIPDIDDKIASWPLGSGIWKAGSYFSTATHDSPAALDVAFSTGAHFALWAGTFLGIVGNRKQLS
ncbi:MAG: hypothetical protein IT292_04095 [Deltaproteobacteria bacterium]|nr:hypothetical protein [Deltaproteobacteria bacterium]